MSWEKEEAKSRHVDFQCVRSRSVNSLLDANESEGQSRRSIGEDVVHRASLDPNSTNAMLYPFLDSAQNAIIPPPPSPRELFPALPSATSYPD